MSTTLHAAPGRRKRPVEWGTVSVDQAMRPGSCELRHFAGTFKSVATNGGLRKLPERYPSRSRAITSQCVGFLNTYPASLIRSEEAPEFLQNL